MARLFFILAIAIIGASGTLRAEPLARAESDYVEAALYADRDGFAPGETTNFAIQLDVRENWHVFWLNPGDAGLPLALDWSLPQGFEIGAMRHPAPDYIPVGPLASYAHEGAPIFTVPVTAPAGANTGETLSIKINASWQVCEEICVPEDAQFSFSLPVAELPDQLTAQNSAVFAAARASWPQTYDGDAAFQRVGDRYQLKIANWTGPAPADAFFFPEQEGLTTPAAPQAVAFEDGVLTVTMAPGWTEPGATGAIAGVLSFGGDDARAPAPISLTAALLAPVAGAPTVSAGGQSLVVLLALAFVGGLILNAMPCVFPILFVKAASLMAAAHHDPKVTRFHGALYGAGVLSTFMAIAAVLLLLRAGGEQLGWGFHLQSPIVTGLSAYVLFAVGLSLAGVFSVGGSVSGLGEGLARREGGSGAFFTGVLAVAVAAPCIGPLLTAPMGAALTLPPAMGLAIFAALAAGLAAPFMALAFSPALGRLLPKPGAWMGLFKQALAFPVFAAAAYFVWVFARQAGDGALAGLMLGLVLLALAAWLFELSKGEGTRALIVRIASAIALAAAVAPVASAAPAPPEKSASAYGSIATEPWSDARLAELRAQGEPVFVDFTAAWCVTCQVNKLSVLRSDAVGEAFAATSTRLLVADWTLRDPEITAALASFGAAGVPLYIYYPAEGEPVVLPQTLTRGLVIETIAGS
ncbi:MAG: thioredoxin family protein [Pseudomonadota bacterium]